LILACTAVFVSPAARASQGSGGWRPEFTPNPSHQANGSLAAVSCSGDPACTAVGNYANSAGRTVTLAERWNGVAWRIQPIPNPAGAGSSQLNGVSCTAARACTAAGYYTDRAGSVRPLAETWNGTTWRIQTAPAPAGARSAGFLAISCASASACTAVGDVTDNAGTSLTLAERWNGVAWRIQSPPNPGGATASGLFAVSCATSSACTATGDSTSTAGATTALAEAWNGSAWAIQPIPNPADVISSQLAGVSCTAPHACVATGQFVDAISGVPMTLAERWNGTRWAIQPTPNPAGAAGSELGAVSCTSASACTAAGVSTDRKALIPGTLAETWNGTRWTLQVTPRPRRARSSGISGVSCVSASACSAAGGYVSGAGVALPLAEGRNGGYWSMQSPAEPFGAKVSFLNGVSCPRDNACTAVGTYNLSSRKTAVLAEAWDGTRWRIQPAPDPAGSASSYLQAVSCPAAGSCTAVGYYSPRRTGSTHTLAEARHGSTWAIQATPSPARAGQSIFYAISCASANACTAAGAYVNHAGTELALAEQWDGTRWRITAPARPAGATASSLSGVSCTSARDCVAVGNDTGSTGQPEPLAEHWNGTSWHLQKVPLPALAQGGALNAVSCSAANACTATGSLSTARPALLAERWNGRNWAHQAAPSPPGSSSTQNISFHSVSCPRARACVATGDYFLQSGLLSFAEAWDGTAWKPQPITLPVGAVGSTLDGASCTPSQCTAVGRYLGTSNDPVTLAERQIGQ